MQRFYSQQSGCTYLEGIHSQMPSDAKPITEKRYLAVIASPTEGKVRGHDDQGLPILIDPPFEQVVEFERAWRNTEIERVKWMRERHQDELSAGLPTSLSAAQFDELVEYIQALRDWPAAKGFPDPTRRPAVPALIQAA